MRTRGFFWVMVVVLHQKKEYGCAVCTYEWSMDRLWCLFDFYRLSTATAVTTQRYNMSVKCCLSVSAYPLFVPNSYVNRHGDVAQVSHTVSFANNLENHLCTFEKCCWVGYNLGHLVPSLHTPRQVWFECRNLQVGLRLEPEVSQSSGLESSLSRNPRPKYTEF